MATAATMAATAAARKAALMTAAAVMAMAPKVALTAWAAVATTTRGTARRVDDGTCG